MIHVRAGASRTKCFQDQIDSAFHTLGDSFHFWSVDWPLWPPLHFQLWHKVGDGSELRRHHTIPHSSFIPTGFCWCLNALSTSSLHALLQTPVRRSCADHRGELQSAPHSPHPGCTTSLQNLSLLARKNGTRWHLQQGTFRPVGEKWNRWNEGLEK